ncbi:hypothetical protein ACTFIV_010373 [Dictyostelium citrinum]
MENNNKHLYLFISHIAMNYLHSNKTIIINNLKMPFKKLKFETIEELYQEYKKIMNQHQQVINTNVQTIQVNQSNFYYDLVEFQIRLNENQPIQFELFELSQLNFEFLQ